MKTIKFLGYLIVCLSLLSLMYVSCLAWIDPSAVMQLVGVELNNNDALSSIRGVYGGVGFTLIAVIIFFTLKNLRQLTFTSWILDNVCFISIDYNRNRWKARRFWYQMAYNRIVVFWNFISTLSSSFQKSKNY